MLSHFSLHLSQTPFCQNRRLWNEQFPSNQASRVFAQPLTPLPCRNSFGSSFAGARRSLSNTSSERVRDFAFNALAPGPADQANRSDCLCASWQLPPKEHHAGLCRVHPAVVPASYTALHDRDPEHAEMRQVAARLSKEKGTPVKLPSYYQVRREIHRLSRELDLVAVREGAKSIPRARESAESFALSIPAPTLVTQVDEHSLELYVVTPDGIPVASRVHAAVLVCVKTAAILGAVLSLGPLKEEEYMRLVKMALEPKDQQVVRAGCQHAWPCYGKPAIIFHDRGKIFTSERARQVLVDRLGIITEQASPYAASRKRDGRSHLSLDDPTF
jgi:hypothetical protein